MYAQTHSPADAAEAERSAYNTAFTELGLSWHWDAGTHRALGDGAPARERLRRYLETEQAHLLKAYDADFLVNAIQAAKDRRLHA